ncbi:MAG: hypothetical protein ABW217_03975, partial [Polyangiaceae bacterium]
DNKGAGSCEDESGEQHETIEEADGEVAKQLRRVRRVGLLFSKVVELVDSEEDPTVTASVLFAYVYGSPEVLREFKAIVDRVRAAKWSVSGAN